jgi:hypothetical protein
MRNSLAVRKAALRSLDFFQKDDLVKERINIHIDTRGKTIDYVSQHFLLHGIFLDSLGLLDIITEDGGSCESQIGKARAFWNTAGVIREV